MGNFTFNGVSAADLGLVVERYPNQNAPGKKLTSVSIPGRNGVLHYWDGSFQNYTQRYQCWFKSAPIDGAAHRIKQWLLSAPAGARLEDTYDDSVFRHATFHGPMDVENALNRFGRCTIEFDCAPQSYLKSGESAMLNAALINNPTPFASAPLIVVTGSISGLLKVGDLSITVMFPDMEKHTLYIDCDIEECYEIIDGVEVYNNTFVSFNTPPRLLPGTNKLELSGGLGSMLVYPRWWTV